MQVVPVKVIIKNKIDTMHIWIKRMPPNKWIKEIILKVNKLVDLNLGTSFPLLETNHGLNQQVTFKSKTISTKTYREAKWSPIPKQTVVVVIL